MVNISNEGLITINRGDYVEVPLFINRNTRFNPIRYKLIGADKLYVSIAEPNQPFEESIIKKVYTKEDLDGNGDVVISILPGETENLLPGKYFLEIKYANDELGQVYTIFPKKQFWIND